MSSPAADKSSVTDQSNAPLIVGRTHELHVLETLIAGPTGGAIVMAGDPGLGKTTLMGWARARAASHGMRILETHPVESEASIQFAGLHQLLEADLDDSSSTEPIASQRLTDAFTASVSVPNLLPVSLATLTVLHESSRRAPVLILVDDAHWCDEASLDVLLFVARRVRGQALSIIFACHGDRTAAFDRAGLRVLRLSCLGEAAASELVQALAPDLPAERRRAILIQAGGNPLALKEMSLSDGLANPGARTDDLLPLGDRLQSSYAARFRALPRACQIALVTLALNDSSTLVENLAVVAEATDEQSALVTLEPAEEHGLISIGESDVQFSHPLIRTAVRQAANAAMCQMARDALAKVIDDPDRAIWHRAAAAGNPDEEIATALEDTADRAERRHGPVIALKALRRAAELSEGSSARGRRLIDAAELAWLLGLTALHDELLGAAEHCNLSQVDRARSLWSREIAADARGTMPAASLVHIGHRLLDLQPDSTASATAGPPARPESGAVQELGPGASHAREPHEVTADLLLVAAYKLFWHGASSQDKQSVLTEAWRLPSTSYVRSHELLVAALLDPWTHGHRVIRCVSGLTPGTHSSPYELRLYGLALTCIPDFVTARPWLSTAVDGLRAQAGSALLARTLCSSAITAAALGEWRTAESEAAEGYTLALDTDQPRWAAKAAGILTRAAAARGELDRAESWRAVAHARLDAAPALSVYAELLVAEGQLSLAAGRPDEAFDHCVRLFDRTERVFFPSIGTWALVDLVEAAVSTGRSNDASAVVDRVRHAASQTTSRYLRVVAAQAGAMLATDSQREAAFLAALDDDASGDFGQARTCLAYGSWLRRQRRIADARTPLRRARDTFAMLGAVGWRVRAEQELRASGQSRRSSGPEARDELTPQEIEIVELAAQGLSNRDIGARLFISHRTVGSHLYRIFPKLGISSRRELRDIWTDLRPQLTLDDQHRG
jgi:DNA-binding CsgD family transcriptional regulator/tetratricopeptide (TPR) repeat protein